MSSLEGGGGGSVSLELGSGSLEGTGSGPRETTMVTLLPGMASEPDSGDWRITTPAATMLLYSSLTEAFRPSLSRAEAAALRVCPTTLGTVTVCSVSKGMGLSGFRVGWTYACEDFMDVFFASAVARQRAWVTVCLPLETTTLTVVPSSTSVPASGSVRIT